MTDGRSWQGNWKVRLYERVRERGYDSLTAFADAHPTASLVALAQTLGEDDINAVQVFSGLVAEEERSHRLTRLARGQLVRELSEGLPNGWPAVLDDANRFEVAKALSSWIAYTPDTHQDRARQVSATLLATPPPRGCARLAPTTSYCARSCPMRMSSLKPPMGHRPPRGPRPRPQDMVSRGETTSRKERPPASG